MPLIEDFDARDIKVLGRSYTEPHPSGGHHLQGKGIRVGFIAELGELTPGGSDRFMRRGSYFPVLATFCYILIIK